MPQNDGFTLAETLITLVIIGVIAAITVPTLITKYQKEQTVTRLKKTFSEISQAVNSSVPMNGSVNTWDFSLSSYQFFNKYLKNYIKIKDDMFLSEKERHNLTYYYLSGNSTDDNKMAWMQPGYEPHIIHLISGAHIIITNHKVQGVITNAEKVGFMVDINGFKKPNKYGRDLFTIYIWKNHGVRFANTCNEETYEQGVARTREQLKNGSCSSAYQCNKSSYGSWCGALIQKDGWQIKDDYPW